MLKNMYPDWPQNNYMKKNLPRTLIIAFLLCFNWINPIFSQYHTQIELTFMHRSDIDTSKVFSVMPFPCYVQEKIIVPDISTDSISLELRYCTTCWLNTALYFGIEIHHSDTSISPKNYSFDGTTLTFPSFSHDTLNIHYYYNAEFWSYQPKDYFYSRGMCCCYETWHSPFFTGKDMVIDTLCIHMPEDCGYFINLPESRNRHRLSTDGMEVFPEQHLSLFLYDTTFYYKKQLCNRPIINAYVYRGICKKKDTFQPRYSSVFAENKIPLNITSAIQNISTLFSYTLDTIELADGKHRIRTSAWGSTFPVNQQYAFVIFDESFWKSYDWCHEVVHCYNRALPDEKDSSYNFFNESITEYLSILFSADNTKNTRKLYQWKRRKYSKTKDSYPSIFQVLQNAPTSSGQGTYGCVYIKTPYCIYRFSQRIGEDRFLSALRLFYVDRKEKGSFTFTDFEKFMLSHGIAQKDWNLFKQSLYCHTMKQIDNLYR